MSEIPDLSQAVSTFRREPVKFLRAMLGVERPEDHQIEVMNAVAAGERQISMRSGRRVGKTVLLDWLSIWFPMTRIDARVIVTAPAAGQLQDAYIPGFRQWVQKLPPELYQLWNITSEKFTFQMKEQQGFENFVTVRTARADNPEALQGINAPNTLVLVDEAAGVPDITLESLSGSLAADRSSIVLTGNPNRRSGFFYDTHTRLSDFWHTLHVNSEESRLVSRDWVNEKRQQWGQDSNAYRIHVLGEFPMEEEDTFLPPNLVESAIRRDIEPFGPVVWGVDVARFGNDLSALCKRRTNAVIEPVTTKGKLDTMEVAGWIKNEWDRTAPADRPTDIFCDPLNMGAGVVDRLREMGLPAVSVNVSELPANPNSIGDRLRDDLWLQLRAALETREFVLPNDERLRAELIMPRIKYTSTGKTKVESKDSMRSRGVASPNCADSLVLTFAGTGAAAMGKRHDRKQAIKRSIRGIV
jgi:phage terminase large subunit